MQPGPLHLFWTTGVFYFWELQGRFDFVFLVPENYRDSVQFQKVVGLPAVRHVEYMPASRWLARRLYYARRFGELLQLHQPRYVLMHNRSYEENQYLLHQCRRVCPETKRYYYQNGRMSLMWKDDFTARRAGQVEAMTLRYPRLARNPNVAAMLVDLRNKVTFFVNYKLFPFLVSGTVFRPPVNVINGDVDAKATRQLSDSGGDCLLAYLDNEIEAYRSQGIANILKIQHPMRKAGREVLRFLHGEFVESDRILILPSYGYTSRLIESGWSADAVVSHIASRWCEVIQALLDRFPGYEVKMKLHPGSQHDPLWTRITGEIVGQIPRLKMVPALASAEWLVTQSRVIVGDVTTVLWWAALFEGKIVVSLDVFGYPGGDEMKHYPDHVLYVNNAIDILNCQFPLEQKLRNQLNTPHINCVLSAGADVADTVVSEGKACMHC